MQLSFTICNELMCLVATSLSYYQQQLTIPAHFTLRQCGPILTIAMGHRMPVPFSMPQDLIRSYTTEVLVTLLYRTALLVLTCMLARLEYMWLTHEIDPCRNCACFLHTQVICIVRFNYGYCSLHAEIHKISHMRYYACVKLQLDCSITGKSSAKNYTLNLIVITVLIHTVNCWLILVHVYVHIQGVEDFPDEENYGPNDSQSNRIVSIICTYVAICLLVSCSLYLCEIRQYHIICVVCVCVCLCVCCVYMHSSVCVCVCMYFRVFVCNSRVTASQFFEQFYALTFHGISFHV